MTITLATTEILSIIMISFSLLTAAYLIGEHYGSKK